MSATTIWSPAREPGSLSVSPMPKQIEQAEPGGVIWTKRSPSWTAPPEIARLDQAPEQEQAGEDRRDDDGQLPGRHRRDGVLGGADTAAELRAEVDVAAATAAVAARDLTGTLADAVAVFDHARIIAPGATPAAPRTLSRMTAAAPRLRRLPTAALAAPERHAIRALLDEAFRDDLDPDEAFTDDDWQHALGGTHVVLDVDGEIVAHASVVERQLEVAGRALRTGYVEAVATSPARQRRGFGTQVMEDVGEIIRAGYELGGLGTGAQHFYERLGWRVWPGRTSVRTSGGDRATPDDDGFVMILRTPSTPALDEAARISCDWRPGDVW